MRIISTKEEAFQALCIPKNMRWNVLPLRLEEIHEPINCANDTPVNQSIRLCQFGVAPGDVPKVWNCCRGYFRLSEERPFWKSAQFSMTSAAKWFLSGDGIF